MTEYRIQMLLDDHWVVIDNAWGIDCAYLETEQDAEDKLEMLLDRGWPQEYRVVKRNVTPWEEIATRRAYK